jgi:hypothetical protein
MKLLNFTKGFDVDLAKFIEYGYHDIELGDNQLNQFYKSKFNKKFIIYKEIVKVTLKN